MSKATYRFTLLKAKLSSDEDFESAFSCSAQAVQSILHDYDLIVSAQPPDIDIFLAEGSSATQLPISLDKFGSLIKGAFQDDGGGLYQVNNRVRP
jgi:hypothetical protein